MRCKRKRLVGGSRREDKKISVKKVELRKRICESNGSGKSWKVQLV